MTPGATKVLQDMAADDNCDLVREGIAAWCGPRQTTARIVNELLGCVAISVLWKEGPATYYRINETGMSMLRRPELENEVKRALYSGNGAFTIRDDRLVPMDEALSS